MRGIKKLLAALLLASVPFAEHVNADESPGTFNESVEKEQTLVRSMMKLVLLENIKTADGIKAAQDAYLDEHYQDYEFRGGHVYGMLCGLYLHGITVFNRKGPAKTVFFDMTDIYKKLEQSSDEETRAKVRELMRRHGDMMK